MIAVVCHLSKCSWCDADI